MPVPLPPFLRRFGQALLCALLLAVPMALVACSPSAPVVAPLPAEATVLAFGDSLTHGAGAAAGESYPEVLAGLIGRRVVSEGVPGELSRGGLARLEAVLERYRPDLLILCHGTNDLIVRRGAAAEGNLWAMIALAKAKGVQVLLIGVPPPRVVLRDGQLVANREWVATTGTAELGAQAAGGLATPAWAPPPVAPAAHPLYARLARAHGLVYEAEAFPRILADPALLADPIHPNAAGYRRLAEAIAKLLRDQGAV